MTSLIVDDNKLARMTLRQHLTGINTIEVVEECDSATAAYSFLKSNKVDVIFLDVEMPKMSGLELVKALQERPIIIFTTAQDKYAVEAFELSVADYLIKPFTFSRLIQAVEKAQAILKNKNTSVDGLSPEVLFIKENRTIKKIKWADIFWIEAMGDYVKIKTNEKFHIVHTSMRLLEEKLDHNRFLRVHRSYIISLLKIDSIAEGSIIINNNSIPLADTYKGKLLKKINFA
jgi:two-component system, LytTR family, response regulator